MVNRGSEYRFENGETSATRYGCSSCSTCQQSSSLNDEAFRQFHESDAAKLRALWGRCRDNIVRFGTSKTWETMPFAMSLFGPQLEMIHGRPITPRPPEWLFYVPCVPGFTRRFCDASGNYRVCERVDHSDAYIVGTVREGLDPAKMERIMEMRRHFGDCGNCTALKTCDICYARIPKSDAAASGFDPHFELQCQRTRDAQRKMLRVYTEIMEANPQAFESPAFASGTSSFRYGSSDTRLDEQTQSALVLETFPLS